MSNGVREYFAMGGYGLFVWGSFLVTALVVLFEVIAVKWRRRRALLEARMAEEESVTLTVVSEAAR